MASTFKIKLDERDPKVLIEKATSALAVNKITLDGNAEAGVFDGDHVHGGYIVTPDEIIFTINSKPVFLAESEVESWFNEAFC
jgi:hypothetical protein